MQRRPNVLLQHENLRPVSSAPRRRPLTYRMPSGLSRAVRHPSAARGAGGTRRYRLQLAGQITTPHALRHPGRPARTTHLPRCGATHVEQSVQRWTISYTDRMNLLRHQCGRQLRLGHDRENGDPHPVRAPVRRERDLVGEFELSGPPTRCTDYPN